MNRRRIGLAALVVGAGAAVRHRLKARIEVDPNVDEAASTAIDAPQATSNDDDPGADANSSANTTQVAAADLSMEQPDAAAPVIDADQARSSAELLADAAADTTSSSDLLADATIDAPHVGSPTLGDPQVSVAGIDADPAIKLPTMPPAGTPTGEIPAVVLPSASSPSGDSSISEVVASPPSTSLPLPASSDEQPASLATSPSPVIPAAAAVTAPTATHDPLPLAAPAVGDDSDSQRSFRKRHRGWSIVGSILLGLVVVAVIAASFIRLPYYSLEPGSVYDTIERVEAPGDLVSIPNGEIGFVTVAQSANITPWEWLDAKLDNNVNIRHEDEVRGDQTADELREADIRRMQVSKDAAVVVALQRLGFDLVITPLGIEVAEIFDCTAADGVLGTGDLIVGVNGVDVRTGEQLVEELMGLTIGADVDLLIERIDPNNPTQSIATELVEITLGSADAACLPDEVRADEARPFIGIGTRSIFDEEFPIDIDVRTGAVSGPSAGLAFTLAIMDVLSEGELTNGLNVVATGTIDRDGNVGPVGGIHQKTVAAERSGADVFIVPKCCDNFVSSQDGEPLDIPSNYEEALLHADDIIVIGVDTLDEALIALGELGGDVDAFVQQDTP